MTRLDAGKYEINWTGIDGKTYWRTLAPGTTLTAAKKEREAERVRVDSGDSVPPSRLKLADVWADYKASLDSRVIASEMSENSVRLYAQLWRSHIEPRLGDRQVQTITAAHIARLLEELRRKGLSSWTVRGVYRVLSSVLNHAVTRGQLAKSPTHDSLARRSQKAGIRRRRASSGTTRSIP